MARWQKAVAAGAVVTLAVGAALAGNGAYLAAKARLAQVLLNHAWNETRRSATPHRPWWWADTHPVARLRVPRLGVDRIVLAGSSGRTLAFGPGLVPGTPLPGAGGLSIISGHRDTHFSFLEHLRAGDTIIVDTVEGRYRYTVSRFMIIDTDRDPPVLDPAPDRLALVTCYPFHQWTAGGSRRYLVLARPLAAGHS